MVQAVNQVIRLLPQVAYTRFLGQASLYHFTYGTNVVIISIIHFFTMHYVFIMDEGIIVHNPHQNALYCVMSCRLLTIPALWLFFTPCLLGQAAGE